MGFHATRHHVCFFLVLLGMLWVMVLVFSYCSMVVGVCVVLGFWRSCPPDACAYVQLVRGGFLLLCSLGVCINDSMSLVLCFSPLFREVCLLSFFYIFNNISPVVQKKNVCHYVRVYIYIQHICICIYISS